MFGAFGQALSRVAETGGLPTPASALDTSRQHYRHSWPVFLPDGRRFLFLAQSNDPAETAVYQGTLRSTETRRAFAAVSRVAVAGSHVLTLSKGLLIAQPYDAERMQVGAVATTIAEHVDSDTTQRSGGALSAAAAGVVAFRSASADSRLIWFDRTGSEIGAFPTRADYHHPWLSPDETRVGVEKTDPATGRHGVWILDLARGTSSRLLLDPTGAHRPIWSPDGTRIGFGSNRLGGHDLYEIASDGSGGERLVLSSRRAAWKSPIGRSTDDFSCTKSSAGELTTFVSCRSRLLENRRAFSKRRRGDPWDVLSGCALDRLHIERIRLARSVCSRVP